MATDRDTLKFQRSGDSLIKDLYADFGCKTTSVPLFVPMDTKQPSTRNWADEDGEDVFFPTELMLAAYDTEVSIIYTGDTGTFQPKQEALFDYLKGGELSVYSPYFFVPSSCSGRFTGGSSRLR